MGWTRISHLGPQRVKVILINLYVYHVSESKIEGLMYSAGFGIRKCLRRAVYRICKKGNEACGKYNNF